METIYDVNYFIKKFEAIPETLIIPYNRHSGNSHCAHGWCDLEEQQTFNVVLSKEEIAFSELAKEFYGIEGFAPINNGPYGRYQQSTPKQRILAALYDIYEKTYGKKYGEPEQPKVIYKTVVIDSAVKELQTSLTEN